MKKSLLYDRAVALRQGGLSYKEIQNELHIAKSTAHVWLRSVAISQKAIERLLEVQIIGRSKSILSIKSKIAQRNEVINRIAKQRVAALKLDANNSAIVCALLYWAEGSKKHGVRFTNSDPIMISVFLKLLRNAFKIDEDRLKARVHLHAYHNVDKQIDFWSNVTEIPAERIKVYHKANTGLQTHPGYQGCMNVSYYDSRIFTQLQMIYNEFAKVILHGGLV
jgi:hypothetical protein